MSIWKSLLIANSLAILPNVAFAERDNLVGEWGGHCSDTAQCWIEIEPIGERYEVRFRASERGDDTKLLCKLDTIMDRGGPDFIAGRFGTSANAGVFLDKPGVAVVHGAPWNACPVQLNINGRYHVIGD